MKAYWEGKRELFSGLAIEQLEKNKPDAFNPYPVFYFDFNGENYENPPVEEMLDQHLSGWEKIYGDRYRDGTPGYRFERLLEMAAEMTGRRCAVLADEYDKPLIDTMEDQHRAAHTQAVLKGFFSRLKKADDFIRFIFITGVTKFHKVSIFSDLNQLRDISLTEDYAALCGITEKEMHRYFEDETCALAERRKMTAEECEAALRKQYDGYYFHPDSESVYNPYSLFGALLDKDFGSYWFETGTPTFLTGKCKDTGFDVRKLTDGALYASEGTLKNYMGYTLEPVPLLYQTGYLTITDYDRDARAYTLAFPNEEVKYGFVECLMPIFVANCGAESGNDIFTLRRTIERGELDRIKEVLTSLFANITLKADSFEQGFQAVIYLVFTLLGRFNLCEMHPYSGRIDCKVETKKYIYLFEFKRDGSANEALKQIDTKDYALAFAADSRKVIRIGVSFDSQTRKLQDWKVSDTIC